MKKYSLPIMAVLYVITGSIHFIRPEFYDPLMPAWLPSHLLLISISGISEILLGIFLIPQSTRKISAWLIVAMLLVFLFLIHLPMVFDYYKTNNPLLWLAIVRLPVQFYLIWWALKYTKGRVPKRKQQQG